MAVLAEKADAVAADKAAVVEADAGVTKSLLIDHDDSFTHILAHYLGQASGRRPKVISHRNLNATPLDEFTHLILSPGPGHPGEYNTVQTLLKHWNGRSPVLGVCLGHQALAEHFGAHVTHAPKVMHGKISRVTHTGTGLFQNLPTPLTVMRYHSLAVTDLPEVLESTASAEDGVLMGFQHKSLPLYGLQFHPESIGTEEGLQLLQNFFNLHPKSVTSEVNGLGTA